MLARYLEKSDNAFLGKCFDHTKRQAAVRDLVDKRIACNRLLLFSGIGLILMDVFWTRESFFIQIFIPILLFFTLNTLLTLKILILKIVGRLMDQRVIVEPKRGGQPHGGGRDNA